MGCYLAELLKFIIFSGYKHIFGYLYCKYFHNVIFWWVVLNLWSLIYYFLMVNVLLGCSTLVHEDFFCFSLETVVLSFTYRSMIYPGLVFVSVAGSRFIFFPYGCVIVLVPSFEKTIISSTELSWCFCHKSSDWVCVVFRALYSFSPFSLIYLFIVACSFIISFDVWRKY